MRIAIIGGGPAGSFCAIHLLRGAEARGRPVEVVIFDPKTFGRPGPVGCNLCAGVITRSMIENLESLGVPIPADIVQRRIDGFLFVSEGGRLELRGGPGEEFFSVFRGGGPLDSLPPPDQSFDCFLLEHARSLGASHVEETVREISNGVTAEEPVTLRYGEGEAYRADVVVGAFGVNSALARKVEAMGFGYRPPPLIRVGQAEFVLPADFIEETYRNRIKVFCVHFPGAERVKFAALTPKKGYVTATMIGNGVTPEDIDRVFADPRIRAHFPDGWDPPERYCRCFPGLPYGQAQHPFADRLVIIGDAHVSRFYKNGIGSAFKTAAWAARSILEHGIRASDFRRHYYRRCRDFYYTDNRIGRALFKVNDVVSKSRLLSPLQISLARESNRRGIRRGDVIERMLWSLFTGELRYSDILKRAIRLRRNPPARPAGGVSAGPAGVSEGARPDLGPLRDGGRVAIVGGGPGGASCALTVLREAERRGIEVEVVLFESKYFGHHYNQCFGVISPPLLEILRDEFGVEVPEEMLLREITGYVLYSKEGRLTLRDEAQGEVSHALRRADFDRLLFDEARKRGVRVQSSRVTYIEFHPEDVVIYSESGTCSADVVVGAFGLDSALRSALRRRTGYVPPKYLETVVTRIHPDDPAFLDRFEGNIHAHLPPIRGIEFGALVPKGNHITIVVAGRRVDIKILKRFMNLSNVAAMLPSVYQVTEVFKGAFPNGPARGFFGDRYVLVGDSAGLIRPFKGKGINSAVITGRIAGETIMREGISTEAFELFQERCSDLIGDLWYGRLVRWLVVTLSGTLSLDPIIDVARRDATLRQALFGSVSGNDTYRHIVLSCLRPATLAGIVAAYLRLLLPWRGKGAREDPIAPSGGGD